MKVTRMSDGAVLDAIMEDRGSFMPAFDGDGNMFPAWTLYFECGGVAAYSQVALGLLRSADSRRSAVADSMREFLSGLGFEAREEDLPVPVIEAPRVLSVESDASDGRVDVAWHHYGDIVPGFDDDRNPFVAVSSCFEIDDKPVYCQTNVRLAKAGGHDPVAKHREDCVALLASRGLHVSPEVFA